MAHRTTPPSQSFVPTVYKNTVGSVGQGFPFEAQGFLREDGTALEVGLIAAIDRTVANPNSDKRYVIPVDETTLANDLVGMVINTIQGTSINREAYIDRGMVPIATGGICVCPKFEDFDIQQYIGHPVYVSSHPAAGSSITLGGFISPDAGGSAGHYTTPTITIGDFPAISNGTFRVDIDGVGQNVTGLDFTAPVTTIAAIAAVIDTALTGATASASSGKIKITSSTTGEDSAVTNITTEGTGTDISEFLIGGVSKAGEGDNLLTDWKFTGQNKNIYNDTELYPFGTVLIKISPQSV